MMRWFFILWLLAATVWAKTSNIWIGANNGTTGTAANWSLGHVPDGSEVLVFDGTAGSNTICNSSTHNFTVDSVVFQNGFTNRFNVNASITGTPGLNVSNGITFNSPGAIYERSQGHFNIYTLDGTPAFNATTNGRVHFAYIDNSCYIYVANKNSNPTQDWSSAASWNIFVDDSAGFDTFSKLRLTNVVVTITNSASASLNTWVDLQGLAGVVVSNSTLSFLMFQMDFGSSTLSANSSTVTLNTCGCGQPGIDAGNISLNSSVLISGPIRGFAFTNFTLYATNSSIRLNGSNFGVTWKPLAEYSSVCPVYLQFSSTLNALCSSSVIASQAITLASASTFGSFTLSASSFNPVGFTVSAGSITITTGSFVGSNGTIVCTNFVNTGGTFSNMTSTVQLAGNSNVTNLFNLVVGSANASLTGALVNITGTLSGAIGTALNGNNGTLNLSNPGFIGGSVSNVTVTNKPLTAVRTQKAGGKLNDLSRRGAE